MKLAVHCAPSVTVCTPGWMVAVAAGAHTGTAWARRAASAGEASAAPDNTASAQRAARTSVRRVVRLGNVGPPREECRCLFRQNCARSCRKTCALCTLRGNSTEISEEEVLEGFPAHDQVGVAVPR